MKLSILITPEVEGGFSVRVPAMPGCYSEGDTREEALANFREAAGLWFELQAERAIRESQKAELQEIEL